MLIYIKSYNITFYAEKSLLKKAVAQLFGSQFYALEDFIAHSTDKDKLGLFWGLREQRVRMEEEVYWVEEVE